MDEKPTTWEYWAIGGGLLLLLLSFRRRQPNDYLHYAADLIASEEGFRAKPYWDVSRYSWGYGTPAPNSFTTVTEEQARAEMMAHIESDFRYLFPLVRVELKPWQWAALLSFSYNLGRGNADNLIANINAENWNALREQWAQYVYAGGVISQALVRRRERER